MHTSFAETELDDAERETDELLRLYEDAGDRLESLARSNAGRRDIRSNLARFIEARERLTITLDRVQ